MNGLYRLLLAGVIVAVPWQTICSFNPAAIMILMKDDERPSKLPSSYRRIIFTFINRGKEPITIDTDTLPTDFVLSKKEVVSRRLAYFQAVEKVFGCLGIFSAVYFGYRWLNPVAGKPDIDIPTAITGVSAQICFLVYGFSKFITWDIARNPEQNVLFEPVTVAPCQAVSKVICVDANTQLPANCECRIADRVGVHYTVVAQPFIVA